MTNQTNNNNTSFNKTNSQIQQPQQSQPTSIFGQNCGLEKELPFDPKQTKDPKSFSFNIKRENDTTKLNNQNIQLKMTNQTNNNTSFNKTNSQIQHSQQPQQKQQTQQQNLNKTNNFKSSLSIKYNYNESISSHSKIQKSKSAPLIIIDNSISNEEINLQLDKRNEFIKLQKKIDNALVITINKLNESMKVHFDNFHQTVMNDSIPKFVMFIMKIQAIEGVVLDTKHHENNEKLTQREILNINNVINYLATKDNKFKNLVFNFEKKEFIESSAILFYTNFLDCFFITETRNRLIERCIPILVCKLDLKNIDVNKILYDWNTYLTLTKFIMSPKSNSIKNEDIPKLFDKSFLDCCSSLDVLPNCIFYQLKFILNILDANVQKLKIPLLFINFVGFMKQIRLESTETIKEIVNSYKISKNIKYDWIKPKIGSTNNDNKKIDFSHSFKFLKTGIPNSKFLFNNRPEENKTSINNIKTSINNIKTSINNIKTSINNIKTSINNTIDESKVESSEKYWLYNSELIYNFNNGIFYKEIHDTRSLQFQNLWNNEINSIQQKIQIIKNPKNQKVEKKVFYDPIFIKDSRTKPYKFVIYDDENQKWKFNEDVFINFGKYKSINSNSVTTPLVLFMNSFDDDIKNIVSMLITSPYPDFDEKDDQIYIYGFCDRYLPYLNYYVDFDDKENFEIKPLFLALHVPKSRQNNSNTKNIVIQIYSFLSYICDIQIVILRDEFFLDQIEMNEIISNNMYSSKSLSKPKKIENLNYQLDDDVVVMISDDENEEEIKTEEKNESNNFDIIKNKVIEISQKFLQRKCKTIYLLNDSNASNYNEQIEIDINESSFFKTIFSTSINNNDDDLFKYHYINVNNPMTYKPFLSTIKEYSIKSDTYFDDLLNSFKFTEMTEISNGYIQIKLKKDWKKDLEDLIKKRIDMYKQYSTSNLLIVSKIKNEIEFISTPFDIDFNNECNSILSAYNVNDNLSSFIEIELEKSFNYFLSNFILHGYEILDKKNVDFLIKRFIYFIKKEYLTIIRAIDPNGDPIAYYKKYSYILYDRIQKIYSKFAEFETRVRQVIRETVEKYENKMVWGETNYEIRQKEKVKEIKCQVETTGDLKDEIPQDY